MSPADLRVALFSGNYNYIRDGANQALNLLVAYLLRQGAGVRIYSPTTATPAFAPQGELVSVPAFAVPGGREEYKLAYGLPRRTRDDLARFRPNLAHVSAPEFLGHRATSWARAQGLPVVASVHTRFETYPRYYGFGLLGPLVVRTLTRFYNRATRVLTPTPSMADLLRGWGVTTPMSPWPRGVDHLRFRPDARSLAWRRSLGIGDEEVAVGFLGRLVLEKGLDVFADVVAALRERGVPHRVLVIGEGPARAWFADKVPEAAFAGFQRGDDLGRAVASMDILFNPSVTETWGQVTSEAMAAGVLVVAARATGAVDLVEDGATGFLVPPRDVAAYADAIERVVAQPSLRAAMSRAGHARAGAWSWDGANEAVLRAYLEVAGAQV